MVVSYSPHGDAGGTLHFPSPKHIHHVDPASAFRQLRRSLSRSPSRGPTFRLVTSQSTSPSPSSPLSPSREPVPNRSVSASILSPTHVSTSTPHSFSNVQSGRKIRPATRRLSPLRNAAQTTPRSPLKRTLSESKDNGNATPQSPASPSEDQENRGSESPLGDPMADIVCKANTPATDSSSFPPRATAKFEKGNSWGTKSSPLKRSDGIMNLEQAYLGSPSRKRRSLHGAMFSADFNIFDHEAALDGNGDLPMTDSNPSSTTSSAGHLTALPKRTSSLRKTTLQQRQDKPLFARSKPNTDLALDFATPGQAPQKNRFRMSLDSVSMPRDSPFSSQGSLPNASAHLMSQHGAKQVTSTTISQPQRHPLSRTISQSTSNSSMAEDSPTHIPVRLAEPRRAFVDFSKSLPVGAARPGPQGGEISSQDSSGTSFATPENYRLVKPFAPAFMSTGLISKRHKNMDEAQTVFGSSMNQMPDTPCKRHSLAEIPSPKIPTDGEFTKAHHARHSFGTPSTPFNPHANRPVPGTFGKGVSIFGSSFGKGGAPRRGSFLSADGEDDLLSPPKQGDSQSSNDFDIPPTPTKQANAPGSVKQGSSGGNAARDMLSSPGFGSVASANTPFAGDGQGCKLIPFGTPSGCADGDGDGLMEDSPLAAIGFRSYFTMPRSFTHGRLLRNSKSPTPLGKASFSAPAFISRRSNAKSSPLSPASPLNDRSRYLSPRTPKESMIPPDPSGLSISAHMEEKQRPMTASSSSAPMFPPATPTANRESHASFNKSTSSMTPSHGPAAIEADPVLTSRFDKVELIGTGEFSQVYRVSQKQEMKKARSYFSIPLGKPSLAQTPLPDRVWAVKRSRHVFIGPKDRQRKLQEVTVLKTLGHSDHTIDLIDSWENRNRLYIQTEYCEEGSLDLFLDQVGRKARLDDFRIWKIMLELSLVSDALVYASEGMLKRY